MTRVAKSVKGRPRVLFYSHDGFGLGHLRRSLAVAAAFDRHVPSAARLLITGSTSVGNFELPDSLDYIRIPGIDKRGIYEKASSVAGDVFALREALIAATISTFSPHMVVVDHNPAGLGGELRSILNRYRKSSRRPRFVLGMRDITSGPEETHAEWKLDNSYELMRDVYDLILVYGSRQVFDPIAEYELPPEIATKMVFTGYFRRPESRLPIHEVRRSLGADDAPLAVVSAGSGADGAFLIETFLQAMQRGLLPDLVASVVLGPQMPASDVDRLTSLADSLAAVTCVQFRNDLESHVAAADVVLSMGGYNSVWEAIGARKRPIVTPRKGGSREQVIRADRLASLGLLTLLHAEDLSPSHLASVVKTELRNGISPQRIVDFNGLERAGKALATMVGH